MGKDMGRGGRRNDDYYLGRHGLFPDEVRWLVGFQRRNFLD
tara:strand:+ start:335 stop:457 length:123 start_codon:yes stop_codon:yes gene_type:complete